MGGWRKDGGGGGEVAFQKKSNADLVRLFGELRFYHQIILLFTTISFLLPLKVYKSIRFFSSDVWKYKIVFLSLLKLHHKNSFRSPWGGKGKLNKILEQQLILIISALSTFLQIVLNKAERSLLGDCSSDSLQTLTVVE